VAAGQRRKVLDVNIAGTFLPCQAFARALVSAGRTGSIVNVTSMSGLVVKVLQPQAAHNASKAAVSMLTASLAIEWLPAGDPRQRDRTGLLRLRHDQGGLHPGARDRGRVDAPHPGRAYGPTCSEHSDSVVGQAVIIDGGFTLV
jgi:NAD(P)-dependent dehydrogenase (short-subunit alcohol dehydrogenase family)